LIVLSFASVAALGQSSTYTNPNVAYSVDFPSSTWRNTQQPDETRLTAEWVYGDRTQGYLVIKKETVEAGVTAEQRAESDRDDRLRYLPGYVDGKLERFAGNLTGTVLTYEFTQSGKAMLGRIYYLQADPRTIYALRLTGYKDKLGLIRNQTDQIARSFKLKQ
jgi:hypothetical protein